MRDRMGNRMPPRVTVSDIGTFWLDENDEVWELFLFAEEPTVNWRKVADHAVRRGGCVGSPITAEFRRLVVVDD